MLTRLYSAFAATVLCGWLALTPASAETRVALVIGNSAYKHSPPLPNPRNDAEDVANALKGLGFEVIFEKDLDKRGMDDAFRRFARSSSGADVAMFFYAGHAMQFGGSNYLMPVDAKLAHETDLPYEMAKVDDITADLQRAKGVRIVVLDACRDNPLAEKLKRSLGPTRSAEARNRGLGRLDAQGLLVAYSTQSGTTADDGDGRNSPFTVALLKHIKTPGLEVSALFRRVRAEVNSATSGRQLPELSDSLIGDFAFRPGEVVKGVDDFAWGLLKDSRDTNGIRRFIDQFPQSPFRKEAEERLALLQSSPPPGGGGVPPVNPLPPSIVPLPPARPPVPPQLGLPPLIPGGGDTRSVVAQCDVLAGAQFEPDRSPGTPGIDIDAINVQQALPACRDAVSGSPGEKRLQFNLARVLFKSGDHATARNSLLPLASGGHAGAMNLIGTMFENGQGLPKDMAQARQWFERGANAGSLGAVVNLARFHEEGLGGLTRDLNRARTLYEQAGNAGVPAALSSLGDMYDEGRGVTKNEAFARQLYERASQGGDARAQVNLGYYYEQGQGGLPKDMVQARQWYERSALGGNSTGMTNLAWLMENGIAGPRDYAQARIWYMRGVAKGNRRAMNNLGVLFENGNGGPKDFGEARKLYEQATNLGYNFAMSNLGDLYDAGRGVTKNEAEARRLYEQAANLGHASAMNSLGLYYEFGKGGLTQDFVQARQWYEKAGNAGSAVGMNNAGLLYENGKGVTANDFTARQWYEKSANRGSSAGMNNYGIMLELGRGGAKDVTEAFRWYLKAAELGNNNAMYNVGLMYANAVGIPQDFVQARAWYEKAAAAGSASAMNNLAILYENGQGGAKDMAKAVQFYQQAANTGNFRAMFNIGLLHEYGRGIPKNEIEGRRWYELAARSNHAGAMDALSMMLAQGRGGARDPNRAAVLMLGALRGGDSDARKRLIEGANDKLALDIRIAIQRTLASEGFQPGGQTGVFGPQTVRALESYAARK